MAMNGLKRKKSSQERAKERITFEENISILRCLEKKQTKTKNNKKREFKFKVDMRLGLIVACENKETARNNDILEEKYIKLT